ncbi:MAG TPA: hypothetical protein GXX72_04625 [Clostridiaceae bacterium]|nr:hypothetical protein [Clostridiaceae bacterium]
MAKMLMIGLTDSGRDSKVNEDTFSYLGRIYPDMISGHEEKSVTTSEYSQLYIVTEGFGGPAIGDLSGRVAQALSLEMSGRLEQYRGNTFDFMSFGQDFLTEADKRIKVQICNKTDQPAGISICLLLIEGNDAYVLNIGNTASFLFRDHELLRLTKPNLRQDGQPTVWLGQGSPINIAEYEPTTKHVVLTPGDIIMLATYSVHSAYTASEMKNAFMSPNAFAGTIRSIHNNSILNKETENHTTLAVKVQSLELSAVQAPIPDQLANQPVVPNPYQRPQRDQQQVNNNNFETVSWEHEPTKKMYNNIDYQSAQQAAAAAKDYSRQVRREEELNNQRGRDRMYDSYDYLGTDGRGKENPFATFFRFLLLGFLIGLVILLIIWFFVLS